MKFAGQTPYFYYHCATQPCNQWNINDSDITSKILCNMMTDRSHWMGSEDDFFVAEFCFNGQIKISYLLVSESPQISWKWVGTLSLAEARLECSLEVFMDCRPFKVGCFAYILCSVRQLTTFRLTKRVARSLCNNISSCLLDIGLYARTYTQSAM